jgi:hypothetical protein
MLRIDPRQRPRLMEIIHNLIERITEQNRTAGTAKSTAYG